jgi:thiamine kinase-like enzyme
MGPRLSDPDGREVAEPVLLDAARAVPAFADVETVTVRELTDGITNRNYLLSGGGERVVVRVFGRDTELLGIDRVAEEAAARAAAGVGVGPPVVAFLPEAGCLVCRFVEGEPISTDDLQRREVLELVVRSVRTFHAGPALPSTFPVFRIVERYEALARERGVPVPPDYRLAHALAGRIEEAFAASPAPEAACHDDLLNANFLREGDHVWLLDYEYAGMGDPYFDLGNLSINNGLTDEAQEHLLRAYVGEVRDTHRARLGLMRLMSDLREAMWGVVQQALSTLEVDYEDYAARHLARLLATADDPRLGDWLYDAREPA